MMIVKLARQALLCAALLSTSTTLALAGGLGPFQAEADCGGGGQVFSGGEAVPFTLRFENQTLNNLSLNMQLRMNIPGIGQINLFSTPLSLGPNQDLAINRSLTLPATIPAGDWSLIVIASGAGTVTFDTCSFNVRN